MKLIFNSDGALWVIDQNNRHKDVAGCTSVSVPDDFDPVQQESVGENGVVVTYKTMAQVVSEIDGVAP
jgi:hypothetical protein